MSIFNSLFSRSKFDLGIVSFLRDMFLKYPQYLKMHRCVCREWNHFIVTNIWSDCRIYKDLKTLLNQNLVSLPVEERHLHVDISIVKGVHNTINLVCDNDVALIDVSNIDAAELLLIQFHGSNTETKLMKLGGFDFSRGEQLLYDVGPKCFCTVFSHRSEVVLWDKIGKIRDRLCVDNNLQYTRTIKIFQHLIFLLSKNKIFILKIDESSFSLSHAWKISCNENLGTVRSVACDMFQRLLFVTAHDRCVLCWDQETDSSNPVNVMHTGLVVEMVKRDNILITVGSLQNLGVTFWDLTSKAKIKTFLRDFVFYHVKLKGNHLLVKGNCKLRGIVMFDNVEFDYFGLEGDPEAEHEYCDITEDKVFRLDIPQGSLVVRDYWSSIL